MITKEDQTLTSCLTRSLQLSDSIYAEICTFEHKNLIKDVLTKSLAGISLEHANSIQNLMGLKNYTTATALLRLQFEAVTRSMWTHFAAKNEYMEKYAGRIDVNKLPPDFPTVTAMIEEILKCPVKGPGEMLRDFKEVTWKGMNNYVHNGFLPIERKINGYPTQLLIQIIKSSNALNIMIAMVLARMTNDLNAINFVKNLQTEYKDCLPKLDQ